MTARNLRNCNPLNLRPSGDNWLGLRVPQTDPGYLQFIDDFHGLRAGAKNLITYYRKHRRDTVRKIIGSWAPPSDNNPTDSYIANVCEHLGVGPDESLNLDNGDTLRRLMEIMILVEGGSQPFARIDLENAINAAYASHSAKPLDPGRPTAPPAPAPTAPAPSHAPPPLVNQPSPMPTRKLVIGGTVGIVVFVLTTVWNRVFPTSPIPEDYATEIAGFLVLVATLLTQYFVRNRATDIPPATPAKGEISES